MSALSARLAVLVVGAALLLSACGDAAPAEPSAEPSSTTPTTSEPSVEPSTPTATATETEEPVPFPADVSVDEQSPSDDAQLTVTDVTTGQHEGYDRVVFRLGGTGTPGWMVRYTEGATDDPAGTELDIAGDGTLQVVLLGFQLPYVTGVEEWGGDPILTPDYSVLREVDVRGQFEGQELAYLGLDAGDHPFRVFALTDPTRVVVDVRHDS